MDPVYVKRRQALVGGLAALTAAVTLVPAAANGDNVLWDRVAICSAPVTPDSNGDISVRAIDDASASVGYPLTTNYEDYADGVFSQAAITLAEEATAINSTGENVDVRVCVDAGRGLAQRDFAGGGGMTILDIPYASSGVPKGQIIMKSEKRTIIDIPG